MTSAFNRLAAVALAVGPFAFAAAGDEPAEPSECPSEGIDLIAGSSSEGPGVIDEMEGRSWTLWASEGVDLKAFPPIGFLIFLK